MRIAILLLGLSLSGCALGPSQDPQAVRQVIERANADAERSYASGDADSLASTFAEDAWQLVPNSAPLVGREAIREFWRNAMTWGKWNFSLRTQAVNVSGPLAVERGQYVLGFVAGSGAPPGMSSFEDHGNHVVYWRREVDGKWMAVWDAPVSVVPPPGSAPASSSAGSTR